MNETPPSERGAEPGSALAAIMSRISGRSLPPVQDWNPERCGEIDIRIARDGDWYHEGARIERAPLVRLFASVLRVDDEGTWLVTPQEKLLIRVDDAPFTAVTLERLEAHGEQVLAFTTNLGDEVIVDADHPIRVDYAHPDAEPAPYVRVRGRLEALILRQCFIELAGLAEVRGECAGVLSRGAFMPLGPSS